MRSETDDNAAARAALALKTISMREDQLLRIARNGRPTVSEARVRLSISREQLLARCEELGIPIREGRLALVDQPKPSN